MDDATKASVVDATSARAVALANPSVIKRPVVQWADGTITVGFTPERFTDRLDNRAPASSLGTRQP